MNGRIYDPLLGRFLSADLLVSAPGNLQSYNRYSYVGNNPLTQTDPSGFESDEDSEERRRKEEEGPNRRRTDFTSRIDNASVETPTGGGETGTINPKLASAIQTFGSKPNFADSLNRGDQNSTASDQTSIGSQLLSGTLGMIPGYTASIYAQANEKAGRYVLAAGWRATQLIEQAFAVFTLGEGSALESAGSRAVSSIGRLFSRSEGVVAAAEGTALTSLKGGEVAFDSGKLAVLQSRLEKQGVTFVTGDEGARLARALGGEAVYIPTVGRPGIIAWGPNPSRTAVIEEVMHFGQHNAAGFGDISSQVFKLEVQAQQRLLQQGARAGWSEAEMTQIQQALQYWSSR